MAKLLIERIYNSANITTWVNYLTKSLSVIAILPILDYSLDEYEISLFLSLQLILGLRAVFDFGLTPTFLRYISYTNNEDESKKANIAKFILETFLISSFYVLIIVVLICLVFLPSQINLLEKPSEGWIAVLCIILVFVHSYYTNSYVSILKGNKKISELSRMEAFYSFLAIISLSVVLLLFKSFLYGIIVYSLWVFVLSLKRKTLCNNVVPYSRNENLNFVGKGLEIEKKKEIRQAVFKVVRFSFRLRDYTVFWSYLLFISSR